MYKQTIKKETNVQTNNQEQHVRCKNKERQKKTYWILCVDVNPIQSELMHGPFTLGVEDSLCFKRKASMRSNMTSFLFIIRIINLNILLTSPSAKLCGSVKLFPILCLLLQLSIEIQGFHSSLFKDFAPNLWVPI